MTKRWFCLFLSAVFLSILCIPCAATDTDFEKTRDYPGFSDVPASFWCADAVELCYESGLMNGVTDTNFAPYGRLTIAQLLVVTARLYHLRQGGDGTIPALPATIDGEDLIRFYNAAGTKVADAGDITATYTDYGETGAIIPNESFVCFSTEKLAALGNQSLTMVVGFDGYSEKVTCTTKRETRQIGTAYPVEEGQHYPNLSGEGTPINETGYVCTAPEGYDLGLALIRADDFSTEELQRYSTAWWFPALFYLWDNNRLSFFHLVQSQFGRDELEEYDPLVRFSQDAARRSDFVGLLYAATGKLSTVTNSPLPPDVSADTANSEAIADYYAAGVLNGVDAKGSFNGSATLTRGQASAMLARILDPELRLHTTVTAS